MSDIINRELFEKIYQNKKILGFTISFIGIFLTDLLIAKYMVFWLLPVVFGIIVGIFLGYPIAGAMAGLGAFSGRFLSILIYTFITPGSLKSADLFLSAIGDVLGANLPPGGLLVTLLSMTICGLFALLGGSISGSLTRIVQYYLEENS
ncbi:MAG: hypothetical protein ACTSPV_03525 [Candidatus Hodarchaeales archaeon]